MEEKKHPAFPLFWFGLAAAGGVWAGSAGCVPPALWLLLFLTAALAVFRKKNTIQFCLTALAVLAAFAYYSTACLYYQPSVHLIHQMGDRAISQQLRLLVTEDPQTTTESPGHSRCDFMAEACNIRQEAVWEKAEGKIRVGISGSALPAIQYGDVIETAGYVYPPHGPRNPGEFDYRSWLETKGVFYEFKADPRQTSVIKKGQGNLLTAWSIQLRSYMLKTLQLGLQDDPQIAALMAGMLFGYKDGIAEDVQEAFRKTGTLHVFAVSGQNVAEILGILLVILQLTGVVRWRWAWLALPALLIFCLATGMQSSAERAFVMAGIILAGWAFCRPVNVLNIAGAAGIFLLTRDPRQLLDCGFQLSFLAVIGLACGGAPLTRRLYEWNKPDPWIPQRLIPWWRKLTDRIYHGICGMVAASISAWLATLGILMVQFHVLSPVTLLANFCVVPLAGLVVTVATLSVFTGWACHVMPLLLNQVNWLLLKAILCCVVTLSKLPGGCYYVGWGSPPEGQARFTFFQAGSAAPALLQYKGKNWLIDCGNAQSWKRTLDPCRRNLGLNRLDGVILTQAGASHLGGATLLLDEISSGFWAESGNSSRAAAQHHLLNGLQGHEIGKRFWRRGDVFELTEGLRVRVLWPSEPGQYSRLEDNGLVLQFYLPEGRLLYAGNISEEVETQLTNDPDLQADCLVQGEHSLTQNFSSKWLEKIKPRYIIRPARGFQSDCSLTPDFWELAGKLGIRVFRMEDTGAVFFEIDSKGCHIRPYLPAVENLEN